MLFEVIVWKSLFLADPESNRVSGYLPVFVREMFGGKDINLIPVYWGEGRGEGGKGGE